MGDCRIAPDIAVYFPGPNDTAEFVRRKVYDFIDHGTGLMWVVTTEDQTAIVVRTDGSTKLIRENDFLDGDDVMPGFRCRLGDLFQPPELESDVPIRVAAGG